MFSASYRFPWLPGISLWKVSFLAPAAHLHCGHATHKCGRHTRAEHTKILLKDAPDPCGHFAPIYSSNGALSWELGPFEVSPGKPPKKSRYKKKKKKKKKKKTTRKRETSIFLFSLSFSLPLFPSPLLFFPPALFFPFLSLFSFSPLFSPLFSLFCPRLPFCLRKGEGKREEEQKGRRE